MIVLYNETEYMMFALIKSTIRFTAALPSEAFLLSRLPGKGRRQIGTFDIDCEKSDKKDPSGKYWDLIPRAGGMKLARIQGIRWFLEHESLVDVVMGFSEPEHTRRAYDVILSGPRKVFLKYFAEKGVFGFLRNRVDPRGKREFETAQALRSFGIPTPAPLGYGLGRGGSFVLQEWIDAEPLWTPVADPDRRPLLFERLAVLLRELREHGVRHNDLHLGNILADKERLHLIDLHKTRIKKAPLSPSDEIVNLAHVLGSLFYEMTDEERIEFFRIYGSPDILPLLEKRLIAERARWVERKKARAFATTSKLTRIGPRVYLKGAEGKGEGPFVESMKNDRKVRVERHADHVRKFYRHSRRLKKAWGNHVVLEYMELPVVPRPFYVEKGGLFRPGFIAMEDLKGKGKELDRFLDENCDGMGESRIRAFIDGLARFMADLFRKRILHRDLKACNIFVLDNGFTLLDVEDLVFRAFDEEDVERMLVQLNTSVPARITFRHRARFFLDFTRALGFGRTERKGLFDRVKKASAGQTVVYEGVGGTKRESWTD